MAAKYGDVLKGVKDTLSKPFNFDKKVELKTSADGISYTAEAVLGTPSNASLKVDYSFGKFKIDSVKLSSDQSIETEFSLADVAPGLKLNFKATDSSRKGGEDKISSTLTAEYNAHKNNFSTVELDLVKFGTKANTSFNFEGFLIGGSAAASFAGGKFAVTDANVLVGYKTGSTTVALSTEKLATVVTAGFVTTAATGITVAGTAKLPITGTGKFSVESGLLFKANSATTLGAKVDNTAKVSLSFAHVLSPLAKLTLSAEVDASKIELDTQRLGLNLNLSA